MQTTIQIDDLLLREAMIASGLETETATVEEALRRLARSHQQARAIADLAGIGWDGNLDLSRLDNQADSLS